MPKVVTNKNRSMPKQIPNKKKYKKSEPGDMFNKHQAKKKMKMLRSGDAVVRSEQNASKQYAGKKGAKARPLDLPSVKMKKKGKKKGAKKFPAKKKK